MSAVRFCFDGRKTKKQENAQAKLLIGHGKQKTGFAEASDGEIKKLADISVPRNMKQSTKYAGTI